MVAESQSFVSARNRAFSVERNRCKCHPETCCCNDWAIFDPDGKKHSTHFLKERANEIALALNQALASASQPVVQGEIETRKTQLLAECAALLSPYASSGLLANGNSARRVIDQIREILSECQSHQNTDHNPKPNITAEALFDAIKHGDSKHQEWLRTALHDAFAGRPITREEIRNQY